MGHCIYSDSNVASCANSVNASGTVEDQNSSVTLVRSRSSRPAAVLLGRDGVGVIAHKGIDLLIDLAAFIGHSACGLGWRSSANATVT
jgi:hypothetical protein